MTVAEWPGRNRPPSDRCSHWGVHRFPTTRRRGNDLGRGPARDGGGRSAGCTALGEDDGGRGSDAVVGNDRFRWIDGRPAGRALPSLPPLLVLRSRRPAQPVVRERADPGRRAVAERRARGGWPPATENDGRPGARGRRRLSGAVSSVRVLTARPGARCGARQRAVGHRHPPCGQAGCSHRTPPIRGPRSNLVIEGSARFVCGAAAGRAFGVTGLAAGITVGTAVALLALRFPMARAPRHERPRTSLIGASLTLALLGLYVQADVLIAPSVLSHAGATTYDLGAVPSKGVYLALLAAGPLLFPFVRRRQGGRRLIAGSALVTLSVGVAVAALLVAARPLIALDPRPPPGRLDRFHSPRAGHGLGGRHRHRHHGRGGSGRETTLAAFSNRDRRSSLVLGLPARRLRVLRCRSGEPGIHGRPQCDELLVGSGRRHRIRRSVAADRISG